MDKGAVELERYEAKKKKELLEIEKINCEKLARVTVSVNEHALGPSVEMDRIAYNPKN